MSCSIHPSWVHDRADCPMCAAQAREPADASQARWKTRAYYLLGAVRHFRLHLDSMTAERDELQRFRSEVLAGCDIQRGDVLYRQLRVVIGPGLTEPEVERDAAKGIIDALCAEMSDYEDRAEPQELLFRVQDLNRRRCIEIDARVKATTGALELINEHHAEVARLAIEIHGWRKAAEYHLGELALTCTAHEAREAMFVRHTAELQEQETEVAALKAEHDRLLRAMRTEEDEIEQVLGKALGYPWFKDDQANFPGATEDNGVCIGDDVAESLAMAAARRITTLTAAQARVKPFIRHHKDCDYRYGTCGCGLDAALAEPQESPFIVCPRCGRRSYNLNDITNRYCGACRQFHDEMGR